MTEASGRDDVGERLTIRPPLQERSRQAWLRILDHGVGLLEEGGYEAFTIAAVCDRAGVVPRAVYARATTKDALFLAVYEHGIDRVRASVAVLGDAPRWRGLAPDRLIAQAVKDLIAVFIDHAAFLRAVVLISGAHPEVYRRGSRYSTEFGAAFTHRLLDLRSEIRHADPEAAVRMAFNTAFSTMVLRTAYGPGFATPVEDGDAFAKSLTDMVSRYLLGAP